MQRLLALRGLWLCMWMIEGSLCSEKNFCKIILERDVVCRVRMAAYRHRQKYNFVIFFRGLYRGASLLVITRSQVVLSHFTRANSVYIIVRQRSLFRESRLEIFPTDWFHRYRFKSDYQLRQRTIFRRVSKDNKKRWYTFAREATSGTRVPKSN